MQKARKLLISQLETAKNLCCAAENIFFKKKKKRKIEEKIFFFQKMSPVCRIVTKTPRSPQFSQNVWFREKIEGGFDKNKLEKVA